MRLSISIFRRLSLFHGWRANLLWKLLFYLSISIFRRLSLFRFSRRGSPHRRPWLSISIFRRLSLFLEHPSSLYVECKSFQSPFSGDFLCFNLQKFWYSTVRLLPFNLHFQETFFVSHFQVSGIVFPFSSILSISIFRRLSLFHWYSKLVEVCVIKLSISIFRRLSLFRRRRYWRKELRSSSFNLHFQETFFVSPP